MHTYQVTNPFPQDNSYSTGSSFFLSLSDPNTKAWLRQNLDPVFGYPTVVRFSWSTCRDLLDSKAVEVQW